MKSKNLLLLVLFLSSCASTHLSKVQVEEQKNDEFMDWPHQIELLQTWGQQKTFPPMAKGEKI